LVSFGLGELSLPVVELLAERGGCLGVEAVGGELFVGAASAGRVVRTRHPYTLESLMTHVQRGRRMQGSWNDGRPHYRCRFPSEYALPTSSITR
jgi:hypothetical protein